MKTATAVFGCLAGAVLLSLSLPTYAFQPSPGSMGRLVNSGVLAQESLGTTSPTTGRPYAFYPDSNFSTVKADGQPGVYFYSVAARALQDHDYQHAVDMLKVSASWAYKPAQYSLGLLYFRGQGVPENRPLGAAWMMLAAERDAPEFVAVRNVMTGALTPAQSAQASQLETMLRGTYGDKVALPRAEAQRQLARSRITGSRVGGA